MKKNILGRFMNDNLIKQIEECFWLYDVLKTNLKRIKQANKQEILSEEFLNNTLNYLYSKINKENIIFEKKILENNIIDFMIKIICKNDQYIALKSNNILLNNKKIKINPVSIFHSSRRFDYIDLKYSIDNTNVKYILDILINISKNYDCYLEQLKNKYCDIEFYNQNIKNGFVTINDYLDKQLLNYVVFGNNFHFRINENFVMSVKLDNIVQAKAISSKLNFFSEFFSEHSFVDSITAVFKEDKINKYFSKKKTHYNIDNNLEIECYRSFFNQIFNFSKIKNTNEDLIIYSQTNKNKIRNFFKDKILDNNISFKFKTYEKKYLTFSIKIILSDNTWLSYDYDLHYNKYSNQFIKSYLFEFSKDRLHISISLQKNFLETIFSKILDFYNNYDSYSKQIQTEIFEKEKQLKISNIKKITAEQLANSYFTDYKPEIDEGNSYLMLNLNDIFIIYKFYNDNNLIKCFEDIKQNLDNIKKLFLTFKKYSLEFIRIESYSPEKNIHKKLKSK